MSPRVVRGSSRRHNLDHLDADDAAFSRPRRRTRPRTKERPDYSLLPVGRVITIDRGRYTCRLEDAEDPIEVQAAKARSLGRGTVIVGDLVRLDGDVSGREGTLARIAEVTERTTVLRRTADDTDPYERPIVANADQLMIVTALADPPPRIGMIDRIMVAGYDAGIAPILCLTKADLADPDELSGAYRPLGVEVVVTWPGADLTPVRDALAGHVTVLIGHSGVGKSTLVNVLVPGADRATGHVNEVTGRGRQTSTSAVALELPEHGGWVIDTPGVRSFGLSHVSLDAVLHAFPDLEQVTAGCPRGCTHQETEPECALDAALAAGTLAPERVASFRRLIAAR